MKEDQNAWLALLEANRLADEAAKKANDLWKQHFVFVSHKRDMPAGATVGMTSLWRTCAVGECYQTQIAVYRRVK
jgi:enamine deaminase RidA (YjgF/YER057c/UK114 family)